MEKFRINGPGIFKNLWVILVLPFFAIGTYGLFDLDEGFYAAVASEMNRRGTWITPLYNGHPWFEKPILLYWLAKPSIALFGVMVGPRLPSVLATLATYGMVFWFSNRRLGPNAGMLSALCLGTSLLFVGAGGMMLVDPLLVACLTGCFIAFWESLEAENPLKWRILSAFALGLAFLAKGPVGGLFFLLLAGVTFWRMPEMRPKFKGGWLPAIAVFAFTVCSWYVPCYLANRHVFVEEFIVKQNLARFAGGDQAHAVPFLPFGFLYYVPILLLGFIPWSLKIHRAWPSAEAQPVKLYLAAWAAIVFGFFTITTTKLPHYILPCFPPLALLVGSFLAEQPITAARTQKFIYGALGLAFLIVFAARSYWDCDTREIQHMAIGYGERFPHSQFVMFAMSGNRPGHEGPPEPKLFGSIPIHINPTSHPSLLLYLNRNVIETDSLSEIPADSVLLTRAPGLDVADTSALKERGLEPIQLEPVSAQHLYRAYHILPLSP